MVLAPVVRWHTVLGEHGLHGIPERFVNDRSMLPGVGVALMRCFSTVGPVLQQKIKSALREPLIAVFRTVGPHAPLAPDACSVEFHLQSPYRFEPKVASVNIVDRSSLGLVDDELAVFRVVTERHRATHPHALLLGGGDLVANSLADQLTLELGEGEQDIQRQPPHAGRGIELLGDRHKGHAAAIEDLDELGKIRERPGQPVDLVHDDYIDPARLDIDQQPLQGRALHGAAGIPAVVIQGRVDPSSPRASATG